MKKKDLSTTAHITICTAVMAVLLALAITLNCVAVRYDKVLTAFLGSTAPKEAAGSSTGLDLAYSKSEFSSKEERETAQRDFMVDVVGESIVLLQYQGDTMPYPMGTTFSFFSHSSVAWVSGGTGSGGISAGGVNLKSVFTAEGFSVNETLWDFYQNGKGKDYVRGVGSISYGGDVDSSINECPLAVLEGNGVLTSAEGTVPVFVLARVGGEGGDLSRGMARYTDIQEDKVRHYLEPDSVELELLAYLNDHFDDVVLLVDANNPVELGWVENYPNIHNVLWASGTGGYGMAALPKIMSGEINPSGHLVDTFAYDAFSAPAMENFGDFVYYPDGKSPTGDSDDAMFYYYTNYKEGVYVGYRYYETRYEDAVLGQGNAGDFDYATTVQYPFGYGLSYTDFAWSDFSVSWNEDQCTATVTVENAGEIAGKDVVQIYAQSPYTDYDRANGIEKAAVVLVGYAKTGLLQPGQRETVSVTFREEELKSYDAKGAGTYILDAGTYYITAGQDAHHAVNNILAAKGKTTADGMTAEGDEMLTAQYTPANTDADALKYAADTVTGTTISNQLDFAAGEGNQYLSRSDWAGTYPTRDGEPNGEPSIYGNRTDESGNSFQYAKSITKEEYAALWSLSALAPQWTDTAEYTYGAQNGLDLVELRGRDYDDPLWDTLLDQMTIADLQKMVSASGYGTDACENVHKPKVRDSDGPAGIPGAGTMTYFSEVCLAQTWDAGKAYRFGQLVGEDGLASGVTGWYAPAANLHRTPFGGRNYEYYSEDPFLSGSMAAQTVVGSAEKGMYTFVKHFAFNEQENHRGDGDGHNGKGELGLVTWLNEQSARELYLKPFEMALKSGTVTQRAYITGEDGQQILTEIQRPAATAVMTAFNRVGTTWAGGCYPLLTGILRGEWGFQGFVITDYDGGRHMDTTQMLLAGGDGKLHGAGTLDRNGKPFAFTEDDDQIEAAARRAAHNILYTVANSKAMNGLTAGTYINNAGTPYYLFLLAAIDGVVLIGVVLLAMSIVKKVKRPTVSDDIKKEEER